MSKLLVLVVDDNPSIYRSLSINLQDSGYATEWAKNGEEALRCVNSKEVAAVLLDLSLGAENGLDVLEKIHASRPKIPVIMITGYGTFEAAVQSIKIGACDFLPKPLKFDRLLSIMGNAIRQTKIGEGGDDAYIDEALARSRLVTRSPKVVSTLRKALVLAKTDLPVLIIGESGCGKELVVDLIHENSPRAEKTLRRINCSAYPESLIDNELFGHEKGAYTGADAVHRGLFEQADRGTLHLDEIAELASPCQAKLLRILEDGTIFRLGGEQSVKVDVRIVASTNKNIPQLIEQGKFREDLFYRLNAVFLYLPPLREREGDVELLLRHFTELMSPGDTPKHFSDDAFRLLLRYEWPGNIRELKNVVQMCVAVTPGDVIDVDALPQPILDFRPKSGADMDDSIEKAEKELISRVLEESKYNKQKASQRLGISRKTLYNKLKDYGIG